MTSMTRSFRFVLPTVLFLIAAESFAAPSMFKERRRIDRLEQADQRWVQPEKVTLNIHYRVPVVETLGYLAAFYQDPQKLTTIAAELRPIATRVETLSGDRFEGRSFPPEVDAECRKLRTEMFQKVAQIYGPTAVNLIESYLRLKYDSLTGGPFSTLGNSID